MAGGMLIKLERESRLHGFVSANTFSKLVTDEPFVIVF